MYYYDTNVLVLITRGGSNKNTVRTNNVTSVSSQHRDREHMEA